MAGRLDRTEIAEQSLRELAARPEGRKGVIYTQLTAPHALRLEWLFKYFGSRPK